MWIYIHHYHLRVLARVSIIDSPGDVELKPDCMRLPSQHRFGFVTGRYDYVLNDGPSPTKSAYQTSWTSGRSQCLDDKMGNFMYMYMSLSVSHKCICSNPTAFGVTLGFLRMSSAVSCGLRWDLSNTGG